MVDNGDFRGLEVAEPLPATNRNSCFHNLIRASGTVKFRDKDPLPPSVSISGGMPSLPTAIIGNHGDARQVLADMTGQVNPPVQHPHEPAAVINSYQKSGVQFQSSPVTLDVQNAALLKVQNHPIFQGTFHNPAAPPLALDNLQASGAGVRLSFAVIVKDQRAAAPRITSSPLRNQNEAHIRSFYDANIEVMGQILVVGGKKTISFSTSELEELDSPFVFSLIGKFSHGFPSMRVLKIQMAKFNLKGECLISFLEQKHVLIRLCCEEDYTRIWSRQVLYIAGFPMKMLKWTPNFKPGIEPELAPVWVLLPYLSVHLYDRRSLFTICSAIGKPLRIDGATANLTRASTPRICIEIDLSKSLVSEVPISLDGEQLLQEVEYESVPKYCDRCKHFGHESVKCLVFKSISEVISDVSKGSVQPANLPQPSLPGAVSLAREVFAANQASAACQAEAKGWSSSSFQSVEVDPKYALPRPIQEVPASDRQFSSLPGSPSLVSHLSEVPQVAQQQPACADQATLNGDGSNPTFDRATIHNIKEGISNSLEVLKRTTRTSRRRESCDDLGYFSDSFDRNNYERKDYFSDGDPDADSAPNSVPAKKLTASKGKSEKKQEVYNVNPRTEEHLIEVAPQKEDIGLVVGKNKKKKVKKEKNMRE